VSALDDARAEAARLRAAAEALSKPRNEYETDMATVSGIRRKPAPRADAARWSRFDREAAAWAAVTKADARVKSLEAKADYEAKHGAASAVPFTQEELRAAVVIRTRYGWRKVAKVNAKTVSVETGYSWTDRIPLEQILEVRSA
jgi:hypothetical protein